MEKRRQQERVPPVPEDPAAAGKSLPARSKNAELERVCKGLDDLKDELTCKPANPLPAVSGTSTPAATDVAMEEVSDTVQLDPRKTQSEPPLSPRSIVGATPEDAEPSLPAEGTGEPEGPPNAGTSLRAGAQENLKALPMLEPACLQVAQKNLKVLPMLEPACLEPAAPSPTGGTAATPVMNGSWLLENAHPQVPDDLSDLDTVNN